MSILAEVLQRLFTSRFATKTKLDGTPSNLSVIIGSVGTMFDGLDPAQTNLASQFSVTSASGSALDQNGADWGVTRRAGESDSAYRARILAVIPTYAQGPTVPAFSSAIQVFTGVAPEIYPATQYEVLFPLTFPFQFGGNNIQDYFTVDVHIQNPNHVAYQRQDVIDAVMNAKRVIATVNLWWEDGTKTVVQ